MTRFPSLVLLVTFLAVSGCREKSPDDPATKPASTQEDGIFRAARQAMTVRERATFGTLIHFYGDSIMRGFGFHDYAHPSFLNRIPDTVGVLLKASGLTPATVAPRYPGTQDPGAIWADVYLGLVRPGDSVVWEDAGQHFDDLEAYRKWVELVSFAAFSGKKPQDGKPGAEVRLVFTTTADYDPPPAYYNSQYSIPVGKSDRSINDVIRSEAGRSGALLLEWKALMDRALVLVQPYGVPLMHPDGVHPNHFGNYLYAASLLHLLGYPVPLAAEIQQEFQRYRKELPTRFHATRELSAEELDAVVQLLTDVATENAP